jgi:hypothetical protein
LRRGLDADGAGGGGGHACVVGGDVVDGVRGCGARVEQNGGYERAVEEGFDAEVEVGLGTGDRGAEVGVAVADVDDGWIIAVDLDDGRCAGVELRIGAADRGLVGVKDSTEDNGAPAIYLHLFQHK